MLRTRDINASGVWENGRVFLDGGDLVRIVDIFDKVTGVVGALFGIFRGDAVLVGCDHGRRIFKNEKACRLKREKARQA